MERRCSCVVLISWRRQVRARVEGERSLAWEGNCWWRMAVAMEVLDYQYSVRRRRQTPVIHAHGMVVGLHRKLLLSVALDPGDERVGRGEGDVPDQNRLGLVYVGLAVEDCLGVDGHGGPAVEGDGVGGFGHCAGDDGVLICVIVDVFLETVEF